MSSQTEVHDGVVKAFNSFKGFGFITRDKGKDVFFFYEEIVGEDRFLNIGDRVRFTIEKKSKGPRAYNIEKLSSE